MLASIYGSSVAGTALFGPVKVMVDKERADEAVEILAELITADWGDEDEGSN